MVIINFETRSWEYLSVLWLFLQYPLALIKTAADDSFENKKNIVIFERKKADILCESSAWQIIHMKCLDYFLWKMKKKKKECCLLQFLHSALSINLLFYRD